MIVFAGPSLAGIEGAIPSGIECRPPARQGDVYLATLEDPRAIGIVDGLFEGAPSVWHKEILWALSQGIPVLGAASMGALRAAELDLFGMIGVGEIYEGYRDGVLEDDDEVALLHAPEEMGHAPLSVAMVNVRATCDAARRNGVVTAGRRDHLVKIAKSIFYKDRTWARILEAVADGENVRRFEAWLDDNYVDQKQRDALELIERMRAGTLVDQRAEVQDFRFEVTDLWQQHVAEWRRRLQPNEPGDGGFRLIGDDRLYRKGYD